MINNINHAGRHLILGAALALATISGVNMASAADSPYFGRWSVTDPGQQKFSKNGQAYKTFDIQACGKDFCGVSVSDDGKCGPTLFRFLMIHAKADELKGHGMWGTQKKNIEISAVQIGDTKDWDMTFDLGDGHDFNSREGSMPTYDAQYSRKGDASCMAQ